MIVLAVVGALSGLVGVGMGAFGAHALAKKVGDPDDRRLQGYRTGVQYHLIHAVAIIVVAAMARSWAGSSLMVVSGWLFFAGIVLFSGSLYGLASGKIAGRLGLVTPIGGLAFMAGWGVLAFSMMPNSRRSGQGGYRWIRLWCVRYWGFRTYWRSKVCW